MARTKKGGIWMSNLLIGEKPLMVIPALAVKIGLNEALVLQQIHYWVKSSKHVIEGRKWIYNTYKAWQLQFPFWSESTIKRTIHSLEDQGLIITGNWNHSKMDKTKWYTIDYERVEALEERNSETPIPQEEPTIFSESEGEDDTSLTETKPDHPSESKTEQKFPTVEIINYLNEKTNSCYKPSTHTTQEKIRARYREGFTLEDFKKVIDLKVAEWLNHPQMNKYLRPETLFGNKFESYFNQKSSNKIYREEDFNLDD
jgi:uncharacterized phage protein (TIGR02220 family)